MKAFVTGATGFIGRRLVRRLMENGDKVVALVRNSHHGLPEGIRVVEGDIRFPKSLGEQGIGCDILFHLGGLITFDPGKRAELMSINGEGTAHILSASRRWNVQRTVVVSSACTMGISMTMGHLLNEEFEPDTLQLKRNPYMASKYSAEEIALRASKRQDVVIVNPTTVYGPGDRSMNSGTLFQKIATSTIVPVPSGGSNVVDVDDVVEGILASAANGQNGNRYILGGENLSFRKIFAIIADCVGCRPKWIPLSSWMKIPMSAAVKIFMSFSKNRFITPQIVEDMFAYKYYSGGLAEKEIGWKPRYSFRSAVERAWSWYCREGLI